MLVLALLYVLVVGPVWVLGAGLVLGPRLSGRWLTGWLAVTGALLVALLVAPRPPAGVGVVDLLPAAAAWAARVWAHTGLTVRGRPDARSQRGPSRWYADRRVLCPCAAAYLAGTSVLAYTVVDLAWAVCLALGAVAFVWWSGLLDRFGPARRRAARL